MRLVATTSFVRDYARLPAELQRRIDRALHRLEKNPGHPSLQLKKMRGHQNRWECRVSLHYRFTFNREGNTCQLLRVGTHDVLG